MPRGVRKPIEQHVLEGTYRAYRHGPLTDDDKPEPFPPMPADLAGPAAAVWDDLAAILSGVVKVRDVQALSVLCRWVDRERRVSAALDAISPGEKGYSQLMVAAGIATDKVLALSARFGLTPADRAKLRPTEPSGSPKARVMTRPKTALDRAGRPPDLPTT